MIQLARCAQCNAQIRVDIDKINIFEVQGSIIIGLVKCPLCKSLVEVTHVDRSKEEEYNK